MPEKSTRKKMSRLSKQDFIGISWGDVHLSDVKPTCRAENQKDWFNSMRNQLREISELQKFLNVPMFCNGDIFDQWNPSPELINLAIQEWPANCCAIAGNHDLYYHSLRDMDKTGYGVLATTVTVENVNPRYKNSDVSIGYDDPPVIKNTRDGFLRVYGFPYDCHVYNHHHYNEDPDTFGKTVCMIHDFIWENPCYAYGLIDYIKNKGVEDWRKKIDHYDFILFGDNHEGFITGYKKKKNICNTGTVFRRSVKEIEYRPFVGLLRKDGNIEKYELQTPNKDEFIHKSKAIKLEKERKLQGLVHELMRLKNDVLKTDDFEDVLKKAMKKHGTKIQKLILNILAKAQDERRKRG